MAAYRRVYDSSHVTCRLTANNRDQLWNPTLGNKVWATVTFLPGKGQFFLGGGHIPPYYKLQGQFTVSSR